MQAVLDRFGVSWEQWQAIRSRWTGRSAMDHPLLRAIRIAHTFRERAGTCWTGRWRIEIFQQGYYRVYAFRNRRDLNRWRQRMERRGWPGQGDRIVSVYRIDSAEAEAIRDERRRAQNERVSRFNREYGNQFATGSWRVQVSGFGFAFRSRHTAHRFRVRHARQGNVARMFRAGPATVTQEIENLCQLSQGNPSILNMMADIVCH